jgi:4-hydroxy-tetrahydrodipicolinate reductase
MADATRIIVCGAAGRMGAAIIAAAGEDGIEVAGLVEARGHPKVGSLVEIGGRSVPIRADLPRVDTAVIIDFTAPEAAIEHVREAVIRGYPAVVGTTGLTPEQSREIEHAGRKIPVVTSANMSVGVNTLLSLVREAARALGPGADVEIVEMHHGAKKDAPSGTALMLADAAAAGKKTRLVHGRQGAVGPRSRGEIGIHAVRGGDIAGDHTVLFAMPGERLELTHRAHGRDAFARGALLAARFAAGAKPGVYGMGHVLGMEKIK